MPIYEFKCQSVDCGKVIEEYQSLHDEPLKKCPFCGRQDLMKLISRPAKSYISGDPRDELVKARKEGKDIAKKIMSGNEDIISDVYGDK